MIWPCWGHDEFALRLAVAGGITWARHLQWWRRLALQRWWMTLRDHLWRNIYIQRDCRFHCVAFSLLFNVNALDGCARVIWSVARMTRFSKNAPELFSVSLTRVSVFNRKSALCEPALLLYICFCLYLICTSVLWEFVFSSSIASD